MSFVKHAVLITAEWGLFPHYTGIVVTKDGDVFAAHIDGQCVGEYSSVSAASNRLSELNIAPFPTFSLINLSERIIAKLSAIWLRKPTSGMRKRSEDAVFRSLRHELEPRGWTHDEIVGFWRQCREITQLRLEAD